MILGVSILLALSLNGSMPEGCRAPEAFLLQRNSLRNGLLSKREYHRQAFAQEQNFLAGLTPGCWKEYVQIVGDLNSDSITVTLAIRSLAGQFQKLPANIKDSVADALTQLAYSQEHSSFAKARILESIPLVANADAGSFYQPFVFSTDEAISHAATLALIRVIWAKAKDATDRSANRAVNRGIHSLYSQSTDPAYAKQQAKILAAIAAYGEQP